MMCPLQLSYLPWSGMSFLQFAFKEADLSGDGKVDASELKGIFQKIGQ